MSRSRRVSPSRRTSRTGAMNWSHVGMAAGFGLIITDLLGGERGRGNHCRQQRGAPYAYAAGGKADLVRSDPSAARDQELTYLAAVAHASTLRGDEPDW